MFPSLPFWKPVILEAALTPAILEAFHFGSHAPRRLSADAFFDAFTFRFFRFYYRFLLFLLPCCYFGFLSARSLRRCPLDDNHPKTALLAALQTL